MDLRSEGNFLKKTLQNQIHSMLTVSEGVSTVIIYDRGASIKGVY